MTDQISSDDNFGAKPGDGLDDLALRAIVRSFAAEAAALRNTAEGVDHRAVLEAARIIQAATTVFTCASGSSGFVAAKFAHTLCCVNKPARYVAPSEAIHGGLGFIQPGTVAFVVARGGGTRELDPIIEAIRAKRTPLIALTENPGSGLADAADLVLRTPASRESDPLGLMATASFVSAIAVCDALISGVIGLSGFTAADFGLIHPGGAVGAQLRRSQQPGPR